ncbi:hypothetical protein IGI04_034790 [Brassica rapa subsp. trilocularis]|uniref:Uncharacterized protein n=2 Tax=Brassica campestris TaxID=3711 RepID=M4EFC0_BRACM|nr:hypothetical protein IGI04_034790 [Brassica rapa subsp. trilocularis]
MIMDFKNTKICWWRNSGGPGDESKAELKVDFTPSSHMCSSSTSHHLRNLVVMPSARVRRQSSLTKRRKILSKSPLFFFISCSFNLLMHESDMFVMGIMKQLILCFERHRISFLLVQLTHAEMHDKLKLNSLLMLSTFVALYSP